MLLLAIFLVLFFTVVPLFFTTFFRTCPEPVFPYVPYLLAYPSGSSPALSSRRKNTGVNLSKFTLELEEYTG